MPFLCKSVFLVGKNALWFRWKCPLVSMKLPFFSLSFPPCFLLFVGPPVPPPLFTHIFRVFIIRSRSRSLCILLRLRPTCFGSRKYVFPTLTNIFFWLRLWQKNRLRLRLQQKPPDSDSTALPLIQSSDSLLLHPVNKNLLSYCTYMWLCIG